MVARPSSGQLRLRLRLRLAWAWLAMAPVTVGEHGGEGGRRPPALGCSKDGGRHGGGRDWASGSDVERSGDETQRKAVGSDGSAVDAGIAAAAMIRNYATRREEKRNAFVIHF